MVSQTSALSRITQLVVVGALLANVGCQGLRRQSKSPAGSPTTVSQTPSGPRELMVAWSNQVQFGVDTVSNKPVPAICGKLYLLNPASGTGVECEGKVVVDLIDATPRGDAPPKQLEHWEIDCESIKKLAKQDRWLEKAYDLNLPWPSYRGDIGQVQMVVRYEPAAGAPLTTRQVMTLQSSKQDLAIKHREELGMPVN